MDDVASTATTRGDLLRQADDAIAAADRRLMSAQRAVPVLLWSIGLTVMVLAQLGEDLDSGVAELSFVIVLALGWWGVSRLLQHRWFVRHPVAGLVTLVAGVALLPFVEDLDDHASRLLFLVTWTTVALGVAWSTFVYAREGHRLIGAVDAWRSARRDPSARGLDDADLPVDLATVHDLRDRADFEAVAGSRQQGSQEQLFQLRVLVPTFVLMITGILGLAFLVAPIVGLDDSAFAAASATSGALLLAPWAWAFGVDLVRLMLGRQTEANQVQVEVLLYGVRRHHTSGAPVETPSRFSPLATPAGRLLLVAWLAVVVLRVRTSGVLAIAVAAGIMLVATAVFTTWYLRRRRQVRVYPLAGHGSSVVQAPSREVTLHLDDQALHLTDASGRAESFTVPLSQIIALQPVKGLSAMAQSGLGIVTIDAPIVMTGRDAVDDPAIVRLQQMLEE